MAPGNGRPDPNEPRPPSGTSCQETASQQGHCCWGDQPRPCLASTKATVPRAPPIPLPQGSWHSGCHTLQHQEVGSAQPLPYSPQGLTSMAPLGSPKAGCLAGDMVGEGRHSPHCQVNQAAEVGDGHPEARRDQWVLELGKDSAWGSDKMRQDGTELLSLRRMMDSGGSCCDKTKKEG